HMVANAPPPTTAPRPTPDRPLRRRRRGTVLLVACLVLAGASACGDDEDAAPVCEARDELASSLADVVEVDVAGEGPSALEDALEEVGTDLDDLGEVASDELGDEVEGLRSSLAELEAAVGTLDEQASAADAVAVVGDDLTAVV